MNNNLTEEMKRPCNCCKAETMQIVRFYNPDNLSEGEVWECNV